ncbi:MAG: hypothetical protein ACOVQT_09560 [Rubrivivax sp.]|jgi:hypothetical protein
MKKHLVFHLDPLDNSRDMVSLRLHYYAAFASALSQAGWACDFVGLQTHASQASAAGCYRRVIGLPEVPQSWQWYGQYHLLAHNNALPEDLTATMDEVYRQLAPDADMLVTNTPSTLLRRRYPQALVMHYEYGIFSRRPFPCLHQLDPWGYSHKSLLSRYPALGLPCTDAHRQRLQALRDQVLHQADIDPAQVGTRDSIHVPLQSERNWPIRLDAQLCRRDIVQQVLRLHPSSALVVTEKAGHGLSEADRAAITASGRVTLLSETQGLATGSFHTAYCRATCTTSPSLALQTVLWRNQLMAPANASMFLWMMADRDRAADHLASYLGNFSVLQIHDLERVIANAWLLHSTFGTL